MTTELHGGYRLAMRLLASLPRPTFVIVVGALAGALGLAVACGGTAVIDAGGTGGNGAGSAIGGQGASTTTSMSTSTTIPTGPVTSSSSGGPCVACSEYLLDTTETVQFEDLCGYDFGSDSCAPNSSCELTEVLGLCTCGDINGPPGLCFFGCQFSCTGMGMDGPNCQDCVLTNCAGAENDCLADPGTG